MNKLELQILQITLEFMNENCVGPQNSKFIYRALKDKFEKIASVPYSFFISLFDNKEIITFKLLNEKISILSLNVKDAPSSENKSIIKQHNTLIKQDDIDSYYYCTKKTRVKKFEILKTLLEYLEESGNNNIDIKECYSILQKKFNINSFNIAKLKDFLQTDRFVLKSVIKQLLIKYTPENDNSNQEIDIKKFFIKDREKWIKMINCLGVNFLEYLASNGVRQYVAVNNLFAQINDKYDFQVNLLNEENNKICNNAECKILFGFLNLFTEDELLEIFNDENILNEFIDVYLEDIKKQQEFTTFCKEIRDLLNKVHNDNKKARIKYVLPFEVLPSLKKYHTLSDLINEKEENLAFLFDYKTIIKNYLKSLQLSIKSYLNEKFKLLLQRANASNIPNSNWERYVEILSLRHKGYNLTAVGKLYNQTREGIRALEEKYNKLFNAFYNTPSGSLTRQIRACLHNEWYMSLDDIGGIINFHPELFFYLLKKQESKEIEYVEDLDIYYFIDDVDWYKEILSIIDRIEGVLTQEQFITTIQECDKFLVSMGVKIPVELIEKILRLEFKQNGTVYSRNKMGLLPKYKQILAKAFPNGIRVYEKEDLEIFRQEYAKTFNDNQMPENDRALYGRIVACCYLIGKGKYALKKDKYISKELATKIYNYIQESPREIFLTNMLFSMFENELKAEGIDNKYHLQGVLKEIFYNQLYFSRDYISKSKEATSIYNDICNYVKQFDNPVSLKQIMNEFKNVPFTVVNTGLTNENIIKFSGSYIHADKVNMDIADIEAFALAIDEILLGNENSNTHVLFDYLVKHNKGLLQKYNIDNQFKLFSLIQYYLQERYEFRRPYFANKGVEIGHIRERIISYIKDSKEVTFDELKNEFPEVLDRILYNTLSGDEIICCQKSYMHADNLNMSADDIELLKSVIVSLCSDGNSHSTHELLMILDLKYPQLLLKYNIDNQFKLFSIVRYFFGNHFEFSRPYFANRGIKILSRIDRVTEYLRQYDEIKISDLFSYVYENKLNINSITQYINELKDEYVFKDKETIISVEKSKINTYNAQVAEKLILNEMDKDGFLVASKFKHFRFLSNDVRWTDWLLYSCINKYSSKIKVMQTETQMKFAEPVFVLKSIPANNIDDLKSYLKDKLNLNDVMFIQYLQKKGLL